MSVCLLAYLKKDMSDFNKFLYVLPVAVAWCSFDDNALCYVLRVLWMTSRLSIISEEKATLIGHLLKVTHQGAEPGGEVMMSTIARLHVAVSGSVSGEGLLSVDDVYCGQLPPAAARQHCKPHRFTDNRPLCRATDHWYVVVLQHHATV